MNVVLDELDAARFCHFCEEQITGTPFEVRGLFDRVEGWAHEGCLSDASEDADERRRADFYGGSGPQTMREQYDEAAETKRRMR
jgi:hypothetical protein